ncbi:MAG: DUF4910 domain-containing protein [Desulfovibrionaceae bacterium]
MRGSYNKEDAIRAFREVGVRSGDIIFSHVALLSLGFPAEVFSGKDAFHVVFEAMLDVIGPEGSFLSPTYSYSFCRREVFDPVSSPSRIGPFGNQLLNQPGVRRSQDPIFSVAGVGPAVESLFSGLPNECFGPGCLYERLEHAGAKICQIGLGMEFLTGLHYLENAANAPHRYNKLFSGSICEGGRERKERWIYFVRVLGEYSYPSFNKAHDAAIASGKCKKTALGRGFIYGMTFADMFSVGREMLKHNPMTWAANPSVVPLQEEMKRVPPTRTGGQLSRDADLKTIVQTVYPLARDIVSDGFDEALEMLTQVVPLALHKYRTGTDCFTWIVPERWTCRRASLSKLTGEEIFSTDISRLHVMSYSLPFNGVVSRQELMDHLSAHPLDPDAIPFTFKYYERDWGLACTRKQRDALTDENYQVTIDADFSLGELKVGEIVVPGVRADGYVFCAHLCHSSMVNDDMSGVAVCIDIARRLLAGKPHRFTYRFLLLPETIGSAAYLSHHQETIPLFKGGVFLEMLATDHPHSLQKSLRGDTQLDKVCELVMKDRDPEAWTGAFATIVLNDERMFNSQGVNVDMISLSRVLPMSHPDAPYKEYHSSKDDMQHANFENLEKSRDLVLEIIEGLDKNQTPSLRFEGELFCSRFNGLDYTTMHKLVHSVNYYIDGERSIADIACITNNSIHDVRTYCDILETEGLLEWDSAL